MEPAARLSAIYVYPIKSLRGTRLERAAVREGRLAGDRDWLLVDDAGRFLHQRDYPRMARLGVRREVGGIVVEAEGQRPLEIGDSPTDLHGPIRHVRLWRRAAPVMAVPGADKWFSTALGLPCRLMAFAPGAEGLDVPGYETASSLQDATPFHLTSDDSLEDLNARMPEPLPMNRFRPNIVVAGAAPYAVDGWRSFRIGAVGFSWIRACTRCAITMTDQQTGERRSRQPLQALSTYRRRGSEVTFGHYVVALTASLAVGDPVEILPE
jgi:uncharacterized protein YcbX